MDSVSKNTSKNLVYSLGNFILGIGYGLVIPAFLIEKIGTGAFGLVQITLSLMMYLGLISGSLNEAINRIFTIELQEKKYEDANKTFNTALGIYFVVFVIAIPIIVYISTHVQDIFNVPVDVGYESRYLFFFNLISFFLVLFCSVFLVPAYANNRVDLFQSNNIVRNLFRFILILVFVGLISPTLTLVGLSSFVASTIGLVYSVIIGFKIAPYLSLKIKYFDRSKVKPLFVFSSWTMVNQVGILLFLYVDVIIVNLFIGETASGEYGALMQWNTVFRNFSGVLGQLFAPLFMIYYGRKEFAKLESLIPRSLKILGLLLAIPVGMVFGLSKEILQIWLGNDFVHLSNALKMLVSHLSINYAMVLLSSAALVYNNIKQVGIVTFVLGLIHIVLSIVLIRIPEIGFYGPLISALALLGIKNFVFLPLYSSKFTNINKSIFYRIIVQILFVTVLSVGITELFRAWIEISSLFQLCGVLTISGGLMMFVVYGFFLSREEKRFFKKTILKKT